MRCSRDIWKLDSRTEPKTPTPLISKVLEPDSTRDSLPVALQKRYAPEHNWILDFVSRILVEGFRTEGALLTAQDLVGCVDGAGLECAPDVLGFLGFEVNGSPT